MKYNLEILNKMNEVANSDLWKMKIEFMKKGGIHINPKNKGKFNATKKRTGKTTEELVHSKKSSY